MQAPSLQPHFKTASSKVRFCLHLFLIFFFLNSFSSPAADVSKEYQLKAVYLFHFSQFIEWSPKDFATPQSPLTFGVLGANPFDGALEQAVRGESIGEHSLTVKYFQRVEEIDTCHILFISGSEVGQLPSVLKALQGRSILTVSDYENFNDQGGMIQFITEGNRIRFKINREATKAAKLKLSSKLLRLGK